MVPQGRYIWGQEGSRFRHFDHAGAAPATVSEELQSIHVTASRSGWEDRIAAAIREPGDLP